jgi:hypothetical protein
MFTHGYKKCLIQLDSDISAHILQFEVYKGNWNVKNLTLYIVTNGLDPIYLGHLLKGTKICKTSIYLIENLFC